MTIERAIEILNPEHREHYDSIEIVEEACRMGMNALEKQMPRKVIRSIYNVRFCPICQGSVWQNRYECKYCFRCGQALKWEDKKDD